MDTPTERSTAAALAALCALVGRGDATFRDGQLEAVLALVRDRERVLVVQRTGWGKSAVYFVATSMLRAAGAGPTIIVSPLLSLMRDQVAAAARAGVRAVTMNSANVTDWPEIAAALEADAVDVLLVSPERLTNPDFRARQLPTLVARCGLLVVDEAHCISDWGHDFRPDYRRIKDLLAALPPGTPVLATTATANARVVADVEAQLGQDSRGQVRTIRGGLARESLRLGVLDSMTAEQRLAWLLAHLGSLPGSGIIYTLTVAGAEDVASALRAAGHEVAAYTGRTDTAEREELENRLRHNDVKALVATSALGMGFDKPDLGFVVHLGAPSSPVAYYQHIGRAGRATLRADVLLLPGSEDAEIWAYFASASMPRQEQAEAVLAALGAATGPLSTAALETAVDIRRTRLELLLKVLDVDGAVERVRGGWVATGMPWTYDAERYARVAEARRREQRLMLDYERSTGCRMRFLQEALDDPTAAECGRCDRCTGEWFSRDLPGASLATAATSLARVGVVIEPRAQWPTGMDRLGVPVRGRLAADDTLQPGRVVARLSDLGWGGRLRDVLREDQVVPRSLMVAAIDVLREWDWTARPTAVVAMPARGRPQLVASLAQGLAEIGRLPFLGRLEYAAEGPTGGPGGNSAYRLAQVWGQFVVPHDLAMAMGAAAGPILLVDDVVSSRWSLTVAGRTLRDAGASAVLPFALAVEV
ncbi:MAG TPA: RecQ family ATP-dependent DNA helicase [Dermatophilaceae bacterium]|nr:RecQ family ATP-dependent DNA helicase [Dermatophilaceae bacterium]